MVDPASFVPIHTAPNRAMALFVRAILEAEGIDCLIPGEFLSDEWATMTEFAVTVEVPKKDAETALRVLAQARDRGRELADGESAVDNFGENPDSADT